jgi:hypothetical protein
MVSATRPDAAIAAALETPLVGIYGPTTRAERPWRADDETVSRAAICQCHHLRRCQATEGACSISVYLEVSERGRTRLTARDARLKVGEPNGV